VKHPLPILYSFRRCPYAMRARMAIKAAGLGVELREVILRDKPQQMLDISAKATVPVLHLLAGAIIDESLDVMLWALSEHDPFAWLAPETGTHDEALQLIKACDGTFKHHLDRYKYAGRYEGAEATDHRAAACEFLAELEKRLGLAPYLFGAQASLADYAIMPFIRQFANVDKYWFEQTPYPRLQAWLKGLLSADIFTSVMNKYPQWQAGQAPVLFPA
jgi:glutathione S-transferase